jgi:hypothetical protein
MVMYAQAAGFAGQDAINAASVGFAESSGNTAAINAEGNTGLMQIGPAGTRNDAGLGLTQAQLLDPSTNMAAAHELFVRAGNTFAQDWTTWGGVVQKAEAAKLSATLGTTATTASLSGDIGGILGGIAGGAVGDPSLGSSVGSSLGGDADGVLGIVSDIGSAAEWIANPTNWLHVLYVIGGVAVCLVGLDILARPITKPAVAAAKKGAATAAKIGAVVA